MSRAVVLGAAGQDGSYLCERLIGAGVEVHGVSLVLPEPGDEGSAGVTWHELDVCDHAGIARLIDEVAPDELYNLAAISSVAACWADPSACAQVNALAVGNVLDALLRRAQHGEITRFVQASSAEIFGSAQEAPQDEQTPLRPTSPYGAAKAYAHQLVNIYRSRGVHASSVIFYNHESPRRPQSFVSRKITHGVAEIEAGRSDQLVLGDVSVRRDWGWAEDYARAMHLVAGQAEPDDYVIATGEAHSVAEFVDAAFRAIGRDPAQYLQVDDSLRRPSDIRLQVGNAAKAHRVLGWQPTLGFEQIVQRMVDHDRRLVEQALA